MSEYPWHELPNYPWAGCLGSNLRRVGVDWHACTEAAERTVRELIERTDHQWRRMVRDPVWAFYGGKDTPEGRHAYIRRALEDCRARLARWWEGARAYSPADRAIDEHLQRVLREVVE